MKKPIYLKAVFENGKIEIASFISELKPNVFIGKIAAEINKRSPLRSIEFCTEMEYVGYQVAHQCVFRISLLPN